MRRLIPVYVVLMAMLFSTSVQGQIFNHARGIFDKKNKKMVQELVGKTTLVYAVGDTMSERRMREAFQNFWTVNKYVVVGQSKTDSGDVKSISAMFYPTIITAVNARGNATTQSYPYFVYGQSGGAGFMDMESVITAFPLNLYYEFDVLNERSMYQRSMLRIPYMVKNLNEMLSHIKAGRDEDSYYDTIESRSGRIASKTLIIPADLVRNWDVNPNLTGLMKGLEKGRKPLKEMMYNVLDESDISFKGKFKVMTNEEIMALENSPEAGQYALFLPAIADKKYLMVYDLKSCDLLYYEDVPMSMKIKSKDFEKLNKAAGL